MESNPTVTLDNQIKALLAEALQVPPDQVSADLHFGDVLQWDSMGHMEVMISLEAKFGVEITPDTIAELISFSAIREYLKENEYAQP